MAVIRQQTQVFNKPVGVRRINTGEAELWETIKAEADEFTRRAYNDAAQNAQKVGAEIAEGVELEGITTLNPITGKPEAFEAPEGMGKFAIDAYQKVINARYEDSISTEMDIKARELGAKYEYDPKGYETAMSQYISAMAENAEGQYKQYITTTGSKKLAYEKLNVQDRTRKHHRLLETEYIIQKLEDNKNRAYNEALNGNYETAVNLVFTEVTRANNGIDAKLLPASSAREHHAVMNIAVGKGLVERAMNYSTDSDQRNIMKLYLSTKGEHGKITNKKIKELLDNVLIVTDADTKADILNHFTVTSNSFDAVDRDKEIAANEKDRILKAELKEKAKIQGAQTDIAYDKQQDHMFDSASKNANHIYSDDASLDETAATLYTVATQFESLLDQYNNRLNTDSTYTTPEMNADIKLLKRGILEPYILQAAGDGNVDYLQSAIINNDELSRKKLTGKQLLLVDTLRETNINLDNSIVKSILGLTDNPTEKQRLQEKAATIKKIETEQRKTAELNNISEIVDTFASGTVSNEELQNELNRVDSLSGTTFTATQVETQKNRLRNAAAFGELQKFSGTATGARMRAMTQYIESGGEDTTDMLSSDVDIGRSILEKLTTENIGTARAKSSSLASRISQREEKAAALEKANEVYNQVLASGGDLKIVSHRKATDKILKDKNLDDFVNFDSWPVAKKVEAYRIMSHVPPESLISKLKDIMNGQNIENADAYLDHFMRLDNHLTGDGLTTSRFGGVLSIEQRALLNDINQIRITQGGNAQEIAAVLIDRRNDPKSTLAMKQTLGIDGDDIKTVKDYVVEQLDDMLLAMELTPMVEYMARTGKSREEINKQLEQIVDKEYPDVKYVADPRFPRGSMKKSRYGLHAVFPDDDEREEFISIVESQLPNGYSLHAEEFKGSIATSDIPVDQQGYFDTTDSDYAYKTGQKKQVYLVPDDTAVGITYYAHYINEQQELVPLIYEQNGNKIYPMFDKDETEQFRREAALRRKTQLETDFTNAQKNNEIIKKSNYYRNRRKRK